MYCENSTAWIFRLDQNFSWESGLKFERDDAFRDREGIVRLIVETDGRLTVLKGYAWDGCTPKGCFFDLTFGTPDGVISAQTGKPKTFYASLIHDPLYQFVPDGLPMKVRNTGTKTRAPSAFIVSTVTGSGSANSSTASVQAGIGSGNTTMHGIKTCDAL